MFEVTPTNGEWCGLFTRGEVKSLYKTNNKGREDSRVEINFDIFDPRGFMIHFIYLSLSFAGVFFFRNYTFNDIRRDHFIESINLVDNW